jgi:hypothetical protein
MGLAISWIDIQYICDVFVQNVKVMILSVEFSGFCPMQYRSDMTQNHSWYNYMYYDENNMIALGIQEFPTQFGGSRALKICVSIITHATLYNSL